jgi:hypothetical protein
MRKSLFFIGLYLATTTVALHAQVTTTSTIILAPAANLSASSLFTNDQESMTTLQEIQCECGPNYKVNSLHLANSYTTVSYAFQPGYTYEVALNGYGTATGNLANPGPALIWYAISLGTVQGTNQPTLGCINNTDLSTILNYAGQISYYQYVLGDGPTFHGYSTVDLMNNFFTSASINGISNFPNSSTPSTSICNSPFTVSSAVNQFNIESYPIPGDIPALLPTDPEGENLNPTTPPTNTTLNINSVTIYKTPSLIPGVITAAPGWTLNTVPSGISTYYQSGVVGCTIIEAHAQPVNFTTPVFVATISGSGIVPTATRSFTAVGTGGGQWKTTINPDGTVYTQWVSGNPPPTLPAGTPFNILMRGSYNL